MSKLRRYKPLILKLLSQTWFFFQVQKIHDLCEPFRKQLRRSGRNKAVDSSGVLADGSKVADGSDMSETAEGSVLGETAEGSKFEGAGKSLEQLSDWLLSDEDE